MTEQTILEHLNEQAVKDIRSPPWAGRVVAMVLHQGDLIVATEKAVFIYDSEDGTLVPVKWEQEG